MTDINGLTDAIMDAMLEYTGEVEEAIPEIVDSTADVMVKEIRAAAPKRSGKYAKGWTARQLGERTRSKEGYAKLVCNPKRYSIAHLVEYGHAKRNGGRVAGKPHIRPACDKLLPEFEKKIEEAVKR
ncbi:MAG: HK97 gp10 family phage protein [Bacillota bacterium]